MDFDASLPMILEREEVLTSMYGITPGEIAHARTRGGFVKMRAGINYFVGTPSKEVRLPDQFGDRGM